MFLLDTNIFLEILLNQDKRENCKNFINNTPNEQLYVSLFSVYSVGIMLHRKNLLGEFTNFIDHVSNEINTVSLDLEDLKTSQDITKQFNTDFDDAYQYLTAKKYGLDIVSLDKDFDKTDLKRIEP